jgi:serine/threonine-protein kinase
MPVVDAVGAPIAACTHLATSSDHACAVCNGAALCWGYNQGGELGRGPDNLTNTRRAAPIAAPAGVTFVEVSVTGSGGCALTDDGRLFCWGSSTRGQVGAGGSGRSIPTRVGAMP